MVGVVTGAISVMTGMMASRDAKWAQGKANAAANSISNIINSEKYAAGPVNPYTGHANLSGMAQDLSNNMSNAMANLGVATQAAEMQAEEADVALANTLDTLRATGASAGGATALAQAALRSKKGITAGIEQQEVANEKLRAQGEANLQARATAEQMRIQGVQIGEGQRIQEADAAGIAFQAQMQENRWNNQLNRLYSEQTAWQKAAGQAKADETSAIINGIGNMAKAFSDRRLKQNIKLIGKSPKGLKIYVFEYINKIFGKGIYQGVMADEIPQEAIIKHINGYNMVDYSKIDVKFKRI
tara:strand:- start:942 stop:1841 length:900 start_codon:yes stop_codon:yes gene_type:complete